MPQYRLSYRDIERLPFRDVYLLTMSVERDDTYMGLYSTTLDGRIFHLRTPLGESIEPGVRHAWVQSTAEMIEDCIRHGEAPQEWCADVRPLALDPSLVIHRAGRAVTRATAEGGLEQASLDEFAHSFDCFTPDRNRWEFRSGRGKKRCSVDLRLGVRLLSDEVRHADFVGAGERPSFESPWSRPGVITLV